MHSIRRATLDDIEALTALFEAYRAFYEQVPDAAGARAFLSERMLADESVVFVADTSDARLVGFTQLYPSFSSTVMRRIFVLNDLFVSPDARGTGVRRMIDPENVGLPRKIYSQDDENQQCNACGPQGDFRPAMGRQNIFR